MAKIPIFLVGFWLLSNWAGLLEIEDTMKYKNPNESIDIRVEDLISRMTLEEKIGQMLQIERKYASDNVLNKYFIGKDNDFFLQSCFHFMLGIIYEARTLLGLGMSRCRTRSTQH